MKKLISLLLCCALLFGLGAVSAGAAPSLHEAFGELTSFEIYKCDQAQPNGFAASVVFNEMAEDYAWSLNVEWWGEGAPPFVDTPKATFEAFVNARYDVSTATWNQIRQQTVYCEDPETKEWVSMPFYNADDQTYRIPPVGGYGGGEPVSRYVGYVQNGAYYHVYLQAVTYSGTKPTTGVEGKDWAEVELFGETCYEIFGSVYRKYVVTYKNGILKKYKSVTETAAPANLIVPGATVTTTTTTTTTDTEEGTEEVFITVAESETAKLETAPDAFPKDTVVKVEEITATETLETVQTAVKDVVHAFVAYEITATSNNVAVQPNGKVKATFDIPEGYDLSKVAVFYVAPDGTLEGLTSTVDEQTRTVVAELEHFSTYIVAEKLTANEPVVNDNAPTDKDNQPDNTLLWIVIAVVAAAVIGGVAAWYFLIFRKKQQ